MSSAAARDERVGEANHKAKITAADVYAIHARLVAGEAHSSIARDYPIDQKSISGIANGRTWKHLGLPRVMRGTQIVAERAVAKSAGYGRVDNDTPWEDDYLARALVVHHPDGMSLPEIGEAIATSQQYAREIVERALSKLRDACKREGLTIDDLLAAMAMRSRRTGLATANERFAESDTSPSQRLYEPVSAPITDGPLVELEALLSAVEARADFVADVAKRAEHYA